MRVTTRWKVRDGKGNHVASLRYTSDAAAISPFPHEGGCIKCRELRICNACGQDIRKDQGRCTNGRCSRCHEMVCVHSSHAATGESVHGYGIQGNAHFRVEAQ